MLSSSRSRRVFLSGIKLGGLLLGSVTLGVVWGFCLAFMISGILETDIKLAVSAGVFSVLLAILVVAGIPRAYNQVFRISRRQALMDWISCGGVAGWMFTKAVPWLFALILPISLFSYDPLVSNLPNLLGGVILLFWVLLAVSYERAHG